VRGYKSRQGISVLFVEAAAVAVVLGSFSSSSCAYLGGEPGRAAIVNGQGHVAVLGMGYV
jgi:hypothetical protein